MREISRKGCVRVFEHERDLTVNYENATTEYFASRMNIRRRQVLIELNGNSFTISAGAMQWIAGSISIAADVKGVGELIGKAFASKMTKESVIKPKYRGNGLIMLEPTYKHILIEEVSEWNGLVVEDGLFLACDSSVKQNLAIRNNISSALLGGEGLINLVLSGSGITVLESPVPRDELILVNIDNDEIKIDGDYAIAWSNSLNFTVEKSTKTLIGSVASGEKLVNVYRGSGKLLMSPINNQENIIKSTS